MIYDTDHDHMMKEERGESSRQQGVPSGAHTPSATPLEAPARISLSPDSAVTSDILYSSCGGSVMPQVSCSAYGLADGSRGLDKEHPVAWHARNHN